LKLISSYLLIFELLIMQMDYHIFEDSYKNRFFVEKLFFRFCCEVWKSNEPSL